MACCGACEQGLPCGSDVAALGLGALPQMPAKPGSLVRGNRSARHAPLDGAEMKRDSIFSVPPRVIGVGAPTALRANLADAQAWLAKAEAEPDNVTRRAHSLTAARKELDTTKAALDAAQKARASATAGTSAAQTIDYAVTKIRGALASVQDAFDYLTLDSSRAPIDWMPWDDRLALVRQAMTETETAVTLAEGADAALAAMPAGGSGGPGYTFDANGCLTGPASAIKSLQDRLVALRYMTAAEVATGPGVLGPKTRAALRRAKQTNGLPADECADIATMRALTNSAAKPAQTLPTPPKPVTPAPTPVTPPPAPSGGTSAPAEPLPAPPAPAPRPVTQVVDVAPAATGTSPWLLALGAAALGVGAWLLMGNKKKRRR